ncbi:MAG: cupin domain-containing protein [Arcobacteraceae bacterium]
MKRITLFFLLCLYQFGYASDTQTLVVETMIKTTQSWDKSKLKEYPKGEPEITILNIIIPAHSKLDWHKHPVINAGILIKGQLTVVSDSGEILEMKEGDAIVELVDTWHYGKNDSDEPAQIIVFYAGIKDMPISVKK